MDLCGGGWAGCETVKGGFWLCGGGVHEILRDGVMMLVGVFRLCSCCFYYVCSLFFSNK